MARKWKQRFRKYHKALRGDCLLTAENSAEVLPVIFPTTGHCARCKRAHVQELYGWYDYGRPGLC